MNKLIAMMMVSAFTFANAETAMKPQDFSFWTSQAIAIGVDNYPYVCPHNEYIAAYVPTNTNTVALKCGMKNNKWVKLDQYYPANKKFVGYTLSKKHILVYFENFTVKSKDYLTYETNYAIVYWK